MARDAQESITGILRQAGLDEPQKAAKLLPLVYEELRSLARSKMLGFPYQPVLQPTMLVHDAWQKIFGSGQPVVGDRREFFMAAARAMHDLLVDQARRHGAQKAGGGHRKIDFENLKSAATSTAPEIEAVHDALSELDDLQRKVVELRFFAGFTMEETAAILDIPLRTLESDWAFIRLRLYRALKK